MSNLHAPGPSPRYTDAAALRDRRASGCQYDIGCCLCPSPPHRYEGCRAPHAVPTVTEAQAGDDDLERLIEGLREL